MTTYATERSVRRQDAATDALLGSRRSPRLLWNLAATAIVWGTSLVILALWIHGGGIQAVIGLNAETYSTLGRLTGLISANLLLYQVLLMARVPIFERGWGRDGLVRAHRLTGFWSFWLMLAHIALLSIGYAVNAHVNPLLQLWDFVWNYPGMMLATAGTGLLILVVVTSIRKARKKLRYESWHLIHLYAYLGVGLAIPHMLWTGSDFIGQPLVSAYWWTLWAIAAAAVLVFRLLVPLSRSMRHDLRVVAVEADGSNGVTVRMRGRDIHKLGAQAGQFFNWRFLDGPGWTRSHPFSLSTAPRGDELTVTARIVGDGTSRMTRMRKGTKVMFEGPYGAMTGDARRRSKMLMLGAGAGVAPLVAILEAERFVPGEAILVTRDHDPAHALRRPQIARMVAKRGLRHYTLDGHRSHGDSTWIPATHASWAGEDLLRYIAPDIEDYDIFLCGPGHWMDSIRDDLLETGILPSQIHSENFSI
ncbi:MAG: oxidoreductase [Microbacterium sp.]|jgi:predicted ferric reductase|uniref:Flavohemoprotein n=1 Tax=Microbacterium ginsengisoli TaxID=400772 RepID=A0A0F0LZ86_9MICO|nr:MULTISPECIES: ferric reductase-like transmembrane domain-containing protein [Microbacterium]KJL36696.1 Flavohemoprotein [Microbacterium ginsengisoli]MAL06779.1 oxidoreductase [Microbacterium sp.]MCK9917023.1 ferric reductase-like transmembrane domain-containing protein [Microbacteriaceae bacterium K1510]